MTPAELSPILKTLGLDAGRVPVLVRPMLVKESGEIVYLADTHEALSFPFGAFLVHDEQTAMVVTLAVRHHMGTLV